MNQFMNYWQRCLYSSPWLLPGLLITFHHKKITPSKIWDQDVLFNMGFVHHHIQVMRLEYFLHCGHLIRVNTCTSWDTSEQATTKCPVYCFLRPNAITDYLEIVKIFIHGNKPRTSVLSANSAIIFYLDWPILVLNVMFYLPLELRKRSQFHQIFFRRSGSCIAH